MPDIRSIVVFRDGKIRYSECSLNEWWGCVNHAAAQDHTPASWVMCHDFVHFDDPGPGQHASVTYIFMWKDVELVRAATDSDRARLGAK